MRRALPALLLLVAGCAGPSPAGHDPSPHGGHRHAPVATSTGTGATEPSVAPVVGDYNLADVMYLRMAIANHEQGIALVALAEGRALRPEVAELAAAIGATQRTEIDQMRAWLTEWGHSAELDTDPAAHAHHGGMPITDPESIAQLAASPATEFERRFVSVLTGHQHNAVEMARQQQTDGASPAVKKFTGKLLKSRAGQISALLTAGG